MLEPSALPELEAEVMSSNAASEAVLRAVLKQYAFSPKVVKMEVVHRALVKAMTLLPDETFMQCMYLIPDTRHEDGTVAQLNNLAELLQSGNFAQFWELAAEPELRSTLDSFATFDKSIREYVATALEITYRRCPVDVIASALNLPADAAAAFSPAWTRDGAVVAFPARAETEPRDGSLEAPIAYADVAELVKALSH